MYSCSVMIWRNFVAVLKLKDKKGKAIKKEKILQRKKMKRNNTETNYTNVTFELNFIKGVYNHVYSAL